MSDHELSKYFEFDVSDLSANRVGKLSAKQKSKLENAEEGANKIFIGAGIVFILIGVGMSFAFTRETILKLFSGGNLTLDDLLAMVLGGGLPLLTWGFFGFGSFKLARSKFDNSVQTIKGKVNFVKVEKQEPYSSTSGTTSYRTVQQYELRVGKVNFEDVDEELLNIIEEGDTYTFYYTKDTKDILSCEFVAKGK